MNDMNLEELLIKAINASINGGFEILKIYNKITSIKIFICFILYLFFFLNYLLFLN